MAEQLESLKYTFREHGREAVVAQLGSLCTEGSSGDSEGGWSSAASER